MANFNLAISTTSRQDFGVQEELKRYNTSNPPPTVQLTPKQFLEAEVMRILDRWADVNEESSSVGKAALYRMATTADKALIDGVLDKYR